MSRGQIILIGAGILLIVGLIVIISSGSAIMSVAQSLSLDQMVNTFAGNTLGNILDKSEHAPLLTDGSKKILGISTFGIIAGIVLFVNGIISIIIGTIVLLQYFYMID